MSEEDATRLAPRQSGDRDDPVALDNAHETGGRLPEESDATSTPGTVLNAPEPAADQHTRLAPPQPPGPAETKAPPRTGSLLKDRFVLLEQIGFGGMGLVYRAKDLRQEEAQARNPFVALKVLSPEFAQDSRMMIALQREAQKAQTLAHPNVVTVYDFDREDDSVFLTMELLEGQTLAELVRANPAGLPREQAHKIIRGMCLGLAYAHNKEIVHSDFKTGNVFYTHNTETRILDFGIARAVPHAGARDSSDQTTFDVAALGGVTPAYASPQQLAGHELTPRDDVFALAIVSHELLTGVHPFDRIPADEARAQGKALKRHKSLSSRQWRALRRGLAFDEAARPEDAAAFLQLLEGVSPVKKIAAVALVALSITVGYVVYERTSEVLESRPTVAFEDLPQTEQQTINQFLSEGGVAEKYNDVGSALDRYLRAYKQHPRNARAVAGLDRVIDSIRAQAAQSNDPRDWSAAHANLEQIANVDDYLAQRPALVGALSELKR